MENDLKINIKTSDKLLSCLPKRAVDVLERRFGIGRASQRETLESIGQSYGITRERVRQIEEHSLEKIRRDSAFKNLGDAFNKLKALINACGGVVSEKSFLEKLVSKNSKNREKQKNYFQFSLVLGEDFKKLKEDDNFHACWTIDKERAEKVHQTLERLHQELGAEEIINEEGLLVRLAGYANAVLGEKPSSSILKLWLGLSRILGQNLLGEWGFISSPQIKPRGVKDFSYLVMKQHGSPMHFTEVARAIENLVSQNAHPQTVHNELIKDERFVLVGRGLYALASWGYQPGLVRDVIKNVLISAGTLSKEEIIRRVLQERHVKENTILINLNNRSFFKKNSDNTYSAI